MADMKFVEHSEPLDFSEWEFNFGEGNAVAAKAASEAVKNTLDDMPPSLWMPAYWVDSDGIGGPAVTDLLTIYMDLPFAASEDRCAWSCSLSELVDDLIDGHVAYQTGVVCDKEGISIMKTVAAALRAEADKLERVCEPIPETEEISI